MSSDDCKDAMDCDIKECNLKHRLRYPLRLKFKQLNNIYVDLNYQDINYESRNGRRKNCSFGTICNNPKCGYYHKDLALNTRESFRKYWEKFLELSQSEQDIFLEEEEAKIPIKEVEDIEEKFKDVEKKLVEVEEKLDEIEKKAEIESEEEEDTSSSLSYFERSVISHRNDKEKFVAYLILKYNIENKDVNGLNAFLGIRNVEG
jgi:tRNA nucleotidyltransferase/poly(A) polymerase